MSPVPICKYANISEIVQTFLKNNVMTPINQRISTLIERLNLSQNKFAKSLGTSSSRISNVVTNRNKPDSELLQKILLVYRNVSADWLLLDEGDVFRDVSGPNPSKKNDDSQEQAYSLLSVGKNGDILLDSGKGEEVLLDEKGAPFKSIIAALNHLVITQKKWVVVNSYNLSEEKPFPSFLLQESKTID